MKCPICESTNLQIQAHLIYLNNLYFPIENGKIKTISKKALTNIHLDDTRYFIKCKDCEYETENLLTDIASGFSEDEEDTLIMEIQEFINQPKKKRTINYEKKYRNFFKTKPTIDEIIAYSNKINSIEKLTLFKTIMEEYKKA